MGSDIDTPGPTKQEKALTQLQIDAINQSNALTQMMMPYQLMSSGYKPTYDADGNITGVEKMSEAEWYGSLSESDKLSYDINKAASERLLKASKGELEIDPATENKYAEQKAQLQERLAKQLGTGWENSSAGIDAMNQFEEKWNEARSAIRFGEMSNMTAITNAEQAQMLQNQSAFFNSLAATNAGYGNLVGMAASPLSYLQNNRSMNMQAQMNSVSPWAVGAGLIGSLAGKIPGIAASFATGGASGFPTADPNMTFSQNAPEGFSWLKPGG